MCISSSYRFLERFIKISESDDLIFNYARYLIELAIIDNQMLRWKPSQIACSAIYVAKKVLKRSVAWSEFMSEQTGYDERHIRECSKELCIVLNYAKAKPNY